MKREVNRPVHYEGLEVVDLSHVQMVPTPSVRKIFATSEVSRSSVH